MPDLPAPVSLEIASEHSIIQFLQRHTEAIAVKKLCSQNPDTITKWRNEIDVLGRIRGPDYVAMLLGSSAQDFSITLRCERGQSRDRHLDSSTRRCTLAGEATIRLWLDITYALVHVHSLGIIHDDIKPENIMWDALRSKAVLIDFGAANVVCSGGNWGFSPSGTPSYAAPEFLEKQKGPPSDVWAFGVTMLFANGQIALPNGDWFLPRVFEQGKDRERMLAWLQEVDLIRQQLSDDASVLVRMLETDASSRITPWSLAVVLDVH